MPGHPRPPRRAFTLLEALLSIVIIAVVAAVTLPVVNGATDAYADATSARRATENVAFAMERVVRLLRDAPAGTTSNTIGVTTATANRLTFTDGTSARLSSGTLYLIADAAAGEGTLLTNVETFDIQYIGADGVTSVLSTPSTTQRFHVTIRAGGAELRCVAFPRMRMVPQ
jgi:prepilin-type N-terminal cleavage/methylation domain-containing protein